MKDNIYNDHDLKDDEEWWEDIAFYFNATRDENGNIKEEVLYPDPEILIR